MKRRLSRELSSARLPSSLHDYDRLEFSSLVYDNYGVQQRRDHTRWIGIVAYVSPVDL
jgi:hypothetical protein